MEFIQNRGKHFFPRPQQPHHCIAPRGRGFAQPRPAINQPHPPTATSHLPVPPEFPKNTDATETSAKKCMASGSSADESQQLQQDYLTETSFSYQDWFRLRELWNTILGFQKSILIYSGQLEQLVLEEGSYRDHASQIQNLRVRIQILERRTAIGREMILAARYKTNALVVEIEQIRENKKAELDLTSGEKLVTEQQVQIAEDRLKLRKQQNELIFRRRFMCKQLDELFFFPQMARQPSFKRNCCCQKFDLIRGLHLPTVAARLGHNDSEVCAATGFLVQLLNGLGHILDFPFKHRIFYGNSRSWLMTRNNLESYNLFNAASSKSSRDRFDHALYLLCEVAVQLRADCGIGSRELDRPIRLIRELLHSFIGRHRFAQSELLFRHTKCSALSPSVYVTIEKEEDVNPVNETAAKKTDSHLFDYLLPIQTKDYIPIK